MRVESMKCPECGCGQLIESSIIGYKCDYCGEYFNVDSEGNCTEIEFDDWKAAFSAGDFDRSDIF